MVKQCVLARNMLVILSVVLVVSVLASGASFFLAKSRADSIVNGPLRGPVLVKYRLGIGQDPITSQERLAWFFWYHISYVWGSDLMLCMSFTGEVIYTMPDGLETPEGQERLRSSEFGVAPKNPGR